jgi:hypothetical protein
MSVHFGMRLGKGLWMGGGPGVAVLWLLLWLLVLPVAIAYFLVLLTASLISDATRNTSQRKAKQEAKEQSARVMASALPFSELISLTTPSVGTNRRKLWGAYALVPAIGQACIISGSYPHKLRELVEDNTRGAVLLLGVFDDMSLAKAAVEATRTGVHEVNESNVQRVVGFHADGLPIFNND